MNFNLERPCNNCIFRIDPSFPLHPDRAAEIAHALEFGDASFSCHKTTEAGFNPHIPIVIHKPSLTRWAFCFGDAEYFELATFSDKPPTDNHELVEQTHAPTGISFRLFKNVVADKIEVETVMLDSEDPKHSDGPYMTCITGGAYDGQDVQSKLKNCRKVGRYMNPVTGTPMNVHQGRQVGRSVDIYFYYRSGKRRVVGDSEFHNNWEKIA